MVASRSYDFHRRNDVNRQVHRLPVAATVEFKGLKWTISERHFTWRHNQPGLIPAYKLRRLDEAGNTVLLNDVLQDDIVLNVEEPEEDEEWAGLPQS